MQSLGFHADIISIKMALVQYSLRDATRLSLQTEMSGTNSEPWSPLPESSYLYE